MTYSTTLNTHLKTVCVALALLLLPAPLFAEDSDEEVADEYAQYLTDDAPTFEGNDTVTDTFGEQLLINTPTVQQLRSNALFFNIQHRFGQVSSELEDLYGIYAPANIRLELSYGITDWAQVSLGTTKNGSYQDLTYKFALLRQEEPKGMPVSLSYYGQTTLQAGPSEQFDSFSHRVAYFQQLLLARKFNNWFSLQIAPSFMHFNIVDEPNGFTHDQFGISVAGRVRATSTLSVIFEGGQGQLFARPDDEEDYANPFFGLGIEMETSGHAFQVFASSTNQLVGPQTYSFNPYDITEGELFLGFNMTRNWNF